MNVWEVGGEYLCLVQASDVQADVLDNRESQLTEKVTNIRPRISVAIDGDIALIGTLTESFDPNSGSLGLASVFRYDGMDWVEETKLSAADREENDLFGGSVAVSGDAAVVGAPLSDGFGVMTGSWGTSV